MDDANSGVRNECYRGVCSGFDDIRARLHIYGERAEWDKDELARSRTSVDGSDRTRRGECIIRLFSGGSGDLLDSVVVLMAKEDLPEDLKRLANPQLLINTAYARVSMLPGLVTKANLKKSWQVQCGQETPCDQHRDHNYGTEDLALDSCEARLSVIVAHGSTRGATPCSLGYLRPRDPFRTGLPTVGNVNLAV